MTLVNELKEFAKNSGADLIGVASVDRFSEAPSDHHPEDILPGAKSVVSCAQRIPLGVLFGPATAYDRTMGAVHSRLDHLACKIALFLEERGGRAIPVPSDEPYQHWEEERLYGRGDLSHKHAAQAAGLGKLGKNSLFITPQFGNLAHLVSVITDIELEPDALLDWQPCPENCTACLKACPTTAIGDRQEVDQALCRKNMLLKLPKGRIIESCGACRRVCPLNPKGI
jgi:epoxyqueuosine reductase QueG